MGTDAPDQAAQMRGDFPAGRRLRGTQHEGDGPRGLGLVDMDRRVAALAMEAVPEGELLCAMGGVEGVVDVQRDRRRRSGVAVAVDVDQLVAQADRRADVGCVLPARQGRLAGETHRRLRRLAERHLEGRVVAQRIEIVGVLVTGGDGKVPREQDIGQQMSHPPGIALIGDMRGEPACDPEPLLRLRQEQHAAVRTDPPAIERGTDLLAREGWQ